MVLQQIIFGLEIGSYIAIAAVGFTIIYGIINMINFAYGEYMTIGAYVGFVLMQQVSLNVFAAMAITIAVTAVAGLAITRVFFTPVRESGPIPLLLTSIGAGLILRQGFRLIGGSEPRYINFQSTPYRFEELGFFVNTQQLLIIGSAVAVLVVFHVLLTKTDVGIAMRATANDENLAQLSAIPTDTIRRNVWLISSGLAGLSGFLLGTATSTTPLTGFDEILIVIAAAILGGQGSPYGAALGAYVIGLTITFTSGVLPSQFSALGTAVAFLVLITVLLVKPSGITGTEVAT